MKPSEITGLIREDLALNSGDIKFSRVDIERCLVAPIRRIFAGGREGETWDLWLVLEAQPETKNGYKIVFDEDDKEFGLATPGINGQDVLIGFYGTFVSALEAM